MKEVKFRALTCEGKIIKNIGSIEFFEDGSVIVNEEIPVKKLLQYTGLKDKNGKEIHEGDIVKDYHAVFNAGKACVVEWGTTGNPSFCVNGDGGYWTMNGHRTDVYEVIGNIYENPELLKGE